MSMFHSIYSSLAEFMILLMTKWFCPEVIRLLSPSSLRSVLKTSILQRGRFGFRSSPSQNPMVILFLLHFYSFILTHYYNEMYYYQDGKWAPASKIWKWLEYNDKLLSGWQIWTFIIIYHFKKLISHPWLCFPYWWLPNKIIGDYM